MEKEMERLQVTKAMLQSKGSKTLLCGITTDKEINFYGWGDKNKLLKFVVCKGRIDDWCVYVESMEQEQSYEGVKCLGNKLPIRIVKLLVDCTKEIMDRYRI